MKQDFLILFARSTNSFTTITSFTRSLPLRNIDWLEEIRLSIAPKSLPTKPLTKSLLSDPTKEIGQKYPI